MSLASAAAGGTRRGDAEVEISIVIPCRNEQDSISACVEAAFRALTAAGYSGEVVVCDNASRDESAARAAAAGARVVRQPIRGYGATCLRGAEAARGSLLVFVDADGTYDLSLLPRFVEPLRAGYDMVLGTRRNGEILPGAMRTHHRHLLEPVQTRLGRRLFPFHVSDVRCGLRSITSEAFTDAELGATGMEFATEMLVQAARLGLSVVEVPVRFHPRVDRAPRRNVGDGWRVARQLLLVSPSRLFLIPGLVLLVGGLALEIALLPGPLRLGRVQLDYHFMFLGSALAILGLQLVLLGIYAKTYALVQGVGLYDRWAITFNLRYSLERGVLSGAILFLVGVAVNLNLLLAWLAAGGDAFFAVRPAVLALTLMVLGAEVLFASFFLSLVRGEEFGRA